MNDLIAFINARLDEDETVASAAAAEKGGDWIYDDGSVLVEYEIPLPKGEGDLVAVGPQDRLAVSHGRHIARHDPESVLAEADAKRRIVAMHVQVQPEWCRICDVPGDYPGPAEGCTTVRLLALPYASHPDYRDEWRP